MQFIKFVTFMIFLGGATDVIEQGCTQYFFKKATGQLKSSWGQKGDHVVRSILEATNIRHHQIKLFRDGDITPRIFTPL